MQASALDKFSAISQVSDSARVSWPLVKQANYFQNGDLPSLEGSHSVTSGVVFGGMISAVELSWWCDGAAASSRFVIVMHSIKPSLKSSLDRGGWRLDYVQKSGLYSRASMTLSLPIARNRTIGLMRYGRAKIDGSGVQDAVVGQACEQRAACGSCKDRHGMTAGKERQVHVLNCPALIPAPLG